MDLQKLIEEARNDPSLLSIDINEIVADIDLEASPHLAKTQQEIETDVYKAIQPLYVSKQNLYGICKKLVGYRYIDELYQLHRGKHVRWLRYKIGERPLQEDTLRLTNGGIVVDLKFGENGACVLVRVPGAGFFTQYKFDECLTFQKLSDEENLILFSNTLK